MRGRGLKLTQDQGIIGISSVAPHAGAWIETTSLNRQVKYGVASPPMRGRGLKPPLK